jgi:DHA3 family tetracycline resistance protein-like MFS transporter
MNPTTLYITLNFLGALTFSLIFTVNQLYFVTSVGMSPLELVLMGTILEGSVFLFEIPTGIVADVKSRRLSVIIGYALMGVGFILEGIVPTVLVVGFAQVVWGLGFTFTSGATEAWIADEIGEEKAGDAFLRGTQWGNFGALIAIPIGVILGTERINTPIIAGGIALIGISIFLILFMREEGFTPLPPGERSSWQRMGDTLGSARTLVRRQPLLINLLAIGFFYGLYSEGLDRLWTPHFLDNFELPFSGILNVVAWFGVIRAVRLILGIIVTNSVRSRLDLNHARSIGVVSRLISVLIIISIVGFGFSQSFWLTLVLFWVVFVLRDIRYPINAAWVNLKIDDSQVRATLLSASSQVDAIGQIAGGPVVGILGNVSIRTALLSSALFLTPVLPLYTRALRAEDPAVEQQQLN